MENVNKTSKLVVAAMAVSVLLLASACNTVSKDDSDDAMMKTDDKAMMQEDDKMMTDETKDDSMMKEDSMMQTETKVDAMVK